MHNWWIQHWLAFTRVVSRMKAHFSGTLLMWAVIGVTLCLPILAYLLLDNLSSLSSTYTQQPQISLFLKPDIKDEQVKSLQVLLKKRNDVKTLRYVSKSDAWNQMQQDDGTQAIAKNLEKNPLPDAFFITLNTQNPDKIEAVKKELQRLPESDVVLLDSEWIKKLYTILELGKKGLLILGSILAFAIFTIVGNTIRLQISTQREEIEVSQLVGATRQFIRRPFLYAGSIYGLGGGILACGLALIIISYFNSSIHDLATLYGSDFQLSPLSASTALWILLIATTLGWVSAWMAVNNTLFSLRKTN